MRMIYNSRKGLYNGDNYYTGLGTDLFNSLSSSEITLKILMILLK